MSVFELPTTRIDGVIFLISIVNNYAYIVLFHEFFMLPAFVFHGFIVATLGSTPYQQCDVIASLAKLGEAITSQLFNLLVWEIASFFAMTIVIVNRHCIYISSTNKAFHQSVST
jgi:hypothetical protein